MFSLFIVSGLYLLEVHSSPPPTHTQTGVWGIRSHLHTSFVAPVRQLLTSTKMVCRQEMEAAREEKGQRAKDGPEVCVEVAGETLPKLSEKEELQVLVMVARLRVCCL